MTSTRRIVCRRPENHAKDVFEMQENVKIDEPNSHEVLVKIKACVLNKINVDLLREFNIIDEEMIGVGSEISGVVIQVGPDVSRLNIGDEVAGILCPVTSSCNGCSTFCCVSEFQLVKKPSMVSFADAACCVGNGLKAYTALHYMARISGGETVLVVNGATGPGIMAIQLAQLWGAKVITTASSEEEMIILQSIIQPEIGTIVDFTKNQNRKLFGICMDETGGSGVDCIIDNGVRQFAEKFTGEKDTTQPSKHEIIMCLAIGGRWITAQHNLQLDPPNTKVLFLKGATVSFLFKDSWTLSTGQQGRFLHILTDILNKVEKELIKPMVHHTVSFDDVCSTLDNLPREMVGDVVLVM